MHGSWRFRAFTGFVTASSRARRLLHPRWPFQRADGTTRAAARRDPRQSAAPRRRPRRRGGGRGARVRGRPRTPGKEACHNEGDLLPRCPTALSPIRSSARATSIIVIAQLAGCSRSSPTWTRDLEATSLFRLSIRSSPGAPGPGRGSTVPAEKGLLGLGEHRTSLLAHQQDSIDHPRSLLRGVVAPSAGSPWEMLTTLVAHALDACASRGGGAEIRAKVGRDRLPVLASIVRISWCTSRVAPVDPVVVGDPPTSASSMSLVLNRLHGPIQRRDHEIEAIGARRFSEVCPAAPGSGGLISGIG